MDQTEVLLTVAEVALGLAGFSGVMTAFRQRPGQLTAVEIYRLAVLPGASFGAMFLAFLPLALEQLGINGASVWSSASSVMAAFSVIAVFIFLAASRRVNRQAAEIFNWDIFGATTLGHFANVWLQLFNAVHSSDTAAPGIYVVGLLWYLLHAAMQFSRILVVQPAAR